MLVVPGIETIDVSLIDTSLLGHSYYGSSDSIIADLYDLLHDSHPADKRRWLQPMFRDGLTYWAFLKRDATAKALPNTAPRR